MFDYVTHPPLPCWKCGAPVSGWQSKDADCQLESIPPGRVREFYDMCEKCNAWNEYRVVATGFTLEPKHGEQWEEWKAQQEQLA